MIVAHDGPGFLANRCARPFGLEALRLLGEGVADHATIDRIVRMGGGFRMGPFELMDLVGIDVGFEVSKSFWEQSFHEPRWRPSLIQARMVQAGRFGRKAGRGYYDYAAGPRHRAEDPEPPSLGGSGRVAIEGDGRLADELRRARRGGRLTSCHAAGDSNGEVPHLLVDASVGRSAARRRWRRSRASETPVCILCVDGSLAELDVDGGAVGFHVLPPLDETQLVELTAARLDQRRRRRRRSSPSSAHSASTSNGSATHPAWCSAGSSASS